MDVTSLVVGCHKATMDPSLMLLQAQMTPDGDLMMVDVGVLLRTVNISTKTFESNRDVSQKTPEPALYRNSRPHPVQVSWLDEEEEAIRVDAPRKKQRVWCPDRWSTKKDDATPTAS